MITPEKEPTVIALDKRVFLSQLIAAKASIDALIYAIMEDGESIALADEKAERECEHRNKLNLATFGNPRVHWICRECGYEFIEPEREG